jgi:hypothetical protein
MTSSASFAVQRHACRGFGITQRHWLFVVADVAGNDLALACAAGTTAAAVRKIEAVAQASFQ